MIPTQSHKLTFPLGFVHGDPRRTHHLGYDYRQVPASAPDFADTRNYSSPPTYRPPVQLRYHSLAIAGESLAARIQAAKKANHKEITTAAYGVLPLSLNSKGIPWDRPLDCIDLFDTNTVQYLHDYVAAHVRTQVEGPLNKSIQLWGLDNEWEGRANYSTKALLAFIKWLKECYQNNIELLNESWNTRLNDFDSILQLRPIEDSYAYIAPGQFIDWWNFQSQHFTRTLAALAHTAHQTDPNHRGVVHKATQLTLEMPNWRERLLDQSLFAELLRPICGGYYGIDMYGHGDRQSYEINYAYHCIRGSDQNQTTGIMLCENNNHNGPANQFSATQWRLLANGLKGMMFFTTGFAGGTGDWDHFAFHDAQSGQMKEKFFATPRFANHIRRDEAFWTTSTPSQKIPKVALLLPRRDVLLAKNSNRTDANPRYTYPENHRWLCYRWLREQGYWVDVIPYEALQIKTLKSYQALFLIGANHLSPKECEHIHQYVNQCSGRLVADSYAGFYDTHHRQLNQLDELCGITINTPNPTSNCSYQVDSHSVKVSQQTEVTLTCAQVIDPAKNALPVYRNTTKKTLYFPFALGSTELTNSPSSLASMQSDAATAESEEYAAHPDEFEIGRWLRRQLSAIDIEPAYSSATKQELYRVEQPQVDADGNCAIIVSTRAQTQPTESLPAGTIELSLPEAEWKYAWWAATERNDYVPVDLTYNPTTKRYEITLPEVTTAGTIHLYHKYDSALLSIDPVEGTLLSIDAHTPKISPGESFTVNIHTIAPTRDLGDGQLEVELPEGWTASPKRFQTQPIKAGESLRYQFTITVSDDQHAAQPDTLSSLHFLWHSGDAQTNVFTCIEVSPRVDLIPKLLTNNSSYPPSYPYREYTGASYRYAEEMNPEHIADPASAGYGNTGQALTNGFSSIGGQRHSHHRDLIGTDHIARYDSPRADIIFDLKTVHLIMRVIIVAGVADTYPNAVRIYSSHDDADYKLIHEQLLTTAQLEIESPPLAAMTRYMRIQVQWPKNGGCLDEIEIWGR